MVGRQLAVEMAGQAACGQNHYQSEQNGSSQRSVQSTHNGMPITWASIAAVTLGMEVAMGDVFIARFAHG